MPETAPTSLFYWCIDPSRIQGYYSVQPNDYFRYFTYSYIYMEDNNKQPGVLTNGNVQAEWETMNCRQRTVKINVTSSFES